MYKYLFKGFWYGLVMSVVGLLSSIFKIAFSVEMFHVNLSVGARLLSLSRKEFSSERFPFQMKKMSSINLL